MAERRRAIFLDRDGTLVQPRHYPSRPEQLVLFDGIAAPLRRLQAAGWQLVVITNQGGLAHGYFSADDLQRMHDHLSAELARLGVRLDAIYYCPHDPAGGLPELAISCACRKPQPGMLLHAAEDLGLDLQRCWFVGDILDDIEAGQRAGCRTVLVDLGTEPLPPTPLRTPTAVARDTADALTLIAAAEGLCPPPERDYRPARWAVAAPAQEGALWPHR